VFFSELLRNKHIIIIIFRLHEKNKIDTTTVKNKQDNHNEFLKYCTGPLHYTRQHSIVISRNRTEWGAKGLIWLGGPVGVEIFTETAYNGRGITWDISIFIHFARFLQGIGVCLEIITQDAVVIDIITCGSYDISTIL